MEETSRKCACGCGLDLPPSAGTRQKYRDGHKHRAYRSRLADPATNDRRRFWDGLNAVRREARVLLNGERRGQGYT